MSRSHEPVPGAGDLETMSGLVPESELVRLSSLEEESGGTTPVATTTLGTTPYWMPTADCF